MYNVWITVKKAFVGIIFGGIAVALAALADYIGQSTLGADAPAWLSHIWMLIVPVVVGGLKAVANWLKNKNV